VEDLKAQLEQKIHVNDSEIVHVGKVKTFLERGKEEVSNEEETEREGKGDERPGQRKQWKEGRQEKREQVDLPEDAHGEHGIDLNGEEPHRDGDRFPRLTRARRAPNRYSPEVGLAVAVLLLGFCDSLLRVQASEGVEHAAFVRDGVIFKTQGDVYFSDSEWIVVTDVSWQPMEEALRRLQKWYGDMLKKDLRGDEAKLGERLRMHLHDRAKDGQDRLDIMRERYRTLREAVGRPEGRSKRGLVDVGGSTLQWLFGVATDRDLESLSNRLQTLGRETTGIVHAIGQQATMVNETWR